MRKVSVSPWRFFTFHPQRKFRPNIVRGSADEYFIFARLDDIAFRGNVPVTELLHGYFDFDLRHRTAWHRGPHCRGAGVARPGMRRRADSKRRDRSGRG